MCDNDKDCLKMYSLACFWQVKGCLKIYSPACFWQVKDCLKMHSLDCFWQVIIERAEGCDGTDLMPENHVRRKFMFLSTITAGGFYGVFTRDVALKPDVALVFLFGDTCTILTPSATMGSLYEVRCCGIHLHGERIP